MYMRAIAAMRFHWLYWALVVVLVRILHVWTLVTNGGFHYAASA